MNPKFSYVFFRIRQPKNLSRTESLHTESPMCINSSVAEKKKSQNSTKWSLQAVRMILLMAAFSLEKKKGNIGYIQSWDIERKEFPLLIKEQRDYHGRFKVYFRMSVAQFDALLAILEPHIKKKTTNFF